MVYEFTAVNLMGLTVTFVTTGSRREPAELQNLSGVRRTSCGSEAQLPGQARTPFSTPGHQVTSSCSLRCRPFISVLGYKDKLSVLNRRVDLSVLWFASEAAAESHSPVLLGEMANPVVWAEARQSQCVADGNGKAPVRRSLEPSHCFSWRFCLPCALS